MSITVTAQPTNAPPRFQIGMSSTSGAAITAAALYRMTNSVSELVRVQPSAGPSPRTVFDVEAAWDTPVTYTAVVTTASGTETFTASAVTLTPSPAVPWLIHPTTPALSRTLDTGAPSTMGVRSQDPVARAAAKTLHTIIGSKYRVPTKTGSRMASTTGLSISTVSTVERDGLWALLDDQTPLLIRFPAAWGWDWEDGYYDVGDVATDRVIQYGPEQRRTFTLPLERVESPAGTQTAQWTCAGLLAAYASCSAVSASYASCTDLLTDTRR